MLVSKVVGVYDALDSVPELMEFGALEWLGEVVGNDFVGWAVFHCNFIFLYAIGDKEETPDVDVFGPFGARGLSVLCESYRAFVILI